MTEPVDADPSAGPGADLTRPVHATPSTLADLAASTGAALTGADRTEVTGLSLSSQRTRSGDLYAALPGSRAHGATYAAEAVAAASADPDAGPDPEVAEPPAAAAVSPVAVGATLVGAGAVAGAAAVAYATRRQRPTA